MPAKYFHRRRYHAVYSNPEVFYETLKQQLASEGLRKAGVQMGLGLTFKETKGNALGSVKALPRRGTLEVLISTVNRRASFSMIFLGLILIAPYILVVGVLTKLQIIPDPNLQPIPVLVLIIAYASLFLIVVYESVIGFFPGTRRLRRILMSACDRAVEKLGGKPADNFTMVTKWVKTNRLSAKEWRVWKKIAWQWLWRPWPDMITEEEFLKETGAPTSAS